MAPLFALRSPSFESSESPSSTRLRHLHRSEDSNRLRRIRPKPSSPQPAWGKTIPVFGQGVRSTRVSRSWQHADMEVPAEQPVGTRPCFQPFQQLNINNCSTPRKSSVKRSSPSRSREHKKSVTFDDYPHRLSHSSPGGSQSIHGTVLRRSGQTRPPTPRSILERSDGRRSPRKATAADTHLVYRRDSKRRPPLRPSEEGWSQAAAEAYEQFWREFRERFEREATAAQARKEEQGHEHKAEGRKPISLAGMMKQGRFKRKKKSDQTGNGDDRLVVKGANPRTGIISPSVMSVSNPTDSSQDEAPRNRAGKKKWRLKGDQWISLDIDQSTPSGGSVAGKNKESTPSSHNGASPVSGPGAVSSDWEDKFVVNMPSAREPNPPTMTAQQIAEFQKSIEKVYREGGTLLDPESLPSPRAITPEEKNTPPQKLEKKLNAGPPKITAGSSLAEADKQPSVSPPLGPRQYYSADDVGREWVSPIAEDSPKMPKEKPWDMGDHSFLGCKEMNGPRDKNPDEILLFPNMSDSPYPSISPSKRKSREKRRSLTHRKRPSEEEKAVLKEDPPSLSQSTNTPQCSKRSGSNDLIHPWPQRVLPKDAWKQISLAPSNSPQQNTPDSNASKKENRGDDDVYIITPTITRTMMPTTMSTSTTCPSLAHQNKNVQRPNPAKAQDLANSPTPIAPNKFGWQSQVQVPTGRPEQPFTAPQSLVPAGGMPRMRHRGGIRQSPEGPSGMPGYTHMPRMMTTEGKMGSPNEKYRRCLCRTCAENNDRRARNLDGLCPVDNASRTPGPVPRQGLNSAPSLAKQRPRSFVRSRPGKVTEVAELDGIQVGGTEEGTRDSSPVTTDTVDTEENEGNPDKAECEKDENDRDNDDKDNDDNVTEIEKEEEDDKEDDKGSETENESDGMSLFSFSVLLDILFLTATHLYSFLLRNRVYHHSAVVGKKILEMAAYCYQVSRRVTDACFVYRRTGSWPKSSSGELALLMRDLGQAGVYFLFLGFVVVILGRIAGYMVLIGSWVVWFAKPFGWIFSWIGKALL